MYRGTAIVACLPVLRGFEPRGDREDVQDPACDSYMESRDGETACQRHPFALEPLVVQTDGARLPVARVLAVAPTESGRVA